MWLADHGTSGPEVVLAVGVAPSRRWAEQWYGLVVAVAPCSVAGCGHLQSFFLEGVRTEERPLGPQRLSRVRHRDGLFLASTSGDEKMVAIRFVALSAAPATRIVAHKALILATQA